MNLLPQRRISFPLLLIPLLLALTALNATAATPEPQQGAPAALLTVDRDDDVGGLACTSADNDCSLRSAIEQANTVGDDYIDFENDMTIVLSNSLPELTDDGTTIAPLNPDRVIEVDANGVSGNVFGITGSDIFIEGLRLYGSGDGWANIWIHGSAQGITIANNVIGDDGAAVGGCGQSPDSHSGIYISSSGTTPSGARAWIYGNTIECHQGIPTLSPGAGIVITGSGTDNVLIGENESGEATSEQRNVIRGNAGDGILIEEGAADNAVRNSDLLDNSGYGIRLNDGDLNQIFGNTVAGNSNGGILIEGVSDSNRIGCPLISPVPALQRNVIRDNGGVGVHLNGPDTATNFLFCNWIGVSDDGASAAPNSSHGVLIDGGAHNNNVGASAETANTISGNSGDGVRISGSDGNVVLGNYIGVNDGGGAAIGNGISGVALLGGASNNTIGSATSDDGGNVISGNAQMGVLLANTGTTNNSIDGNLIGVDVTGTAAIPNGADGIAILNADNNAIGPSGSSTDQLIHYNGGAGIRLLDAGGAVIGTRNTVKYNGEAGISVSGSSSGINVHVQEVYGNGGLPIDLGNDGHTPNDAGDGDSGPNTLLNYPAITNSSGNMITGTACLCTVHIYEAVGDPAAAGGGGILVDSVATDGSGNWSATLPGDLIRLDVTVMAVDTSLNSSEMAPRPQIALPLIVQP